MKRLLILLVVLLSLGLSGCKDTSHSIEKKHTIVSEYLCSDNGGWKSSLITNSFDSMSIYCRNGSSYYISPNTANEFYVHGNEDDNINNKVDAIMKGETQ